MIKIDYKGFTAELVSVGKEYLGVLFTKVPEEYNNIPKEYCGGLHRTLQQKLIDMVDLIDYLIISKEEQKRKTMKTFNVEYRGYVLEIIKEDNPSKLSFKCQEPNLKLFNGLQVSITLEILINSFKEEVDILLAKKEEPPIKKLIIEYKSYILEVEINKEYSYIKGVCESISFENSGHISVTVSSIVALFIETVDLLTESKKEDKSYTHLLTQLDRLAKKDKEDNFTPFELRGQLIEIYHLFGKILSLTVQDINKLYFERAEG